MLVKVRIDNTTIKEFRKLYLIDFNLSCNDLTKSTSSKVELN